MRLSDRDISLLLDEGRIKIDPRPEDAALGPSAIDLRLSSEFKEFRPLVRELELGAAAENAMDSVTVGAGETFKLKPGGFALGVTIERVCLPDDIVGLLDGRSTLGRLGLMVHATAHTIAPGFDGQIVFEFFNAGPLTISLKPGTRVCALSFEPLSSPALRPYGSRQTDRYAGQSGVLAPKLDAD